MAVPSSPSVCSRGLYYPAAPPTAAVGYVTNPSGDKVFAPQGNVAADLGGGGPLPCLCVSVGGSTPDYLQSIWVVFGRGGEVVTRTGIIATATWSSQGSPPATAHWALVDTTT